MRVKLKSLLANPDGVFSSGAVIDVPEEQANELIAGGYAEAVDPPPVKPKKKKGK